MPPRSQDERPTLEDVAAYAGVSRSTASRALNDDAYVSTRSREKVLGAARELGYSPNQAARSLVTRRTGAVAVVLSEPESKVLDDPYFATVMHGAYRELSATGVQMLLMFVDSREDVPRTIRFLEGGHVDGALVFAPHQGDPLPTALRLLRLPVVYGGRPGSARRGVHAVDFDNRAGARLAVRHLLSTGRRRIATVTGMLDHPAASDRLAGWQDALVEFGLDPTGLSEAGDFTMPSGERAMTALLERAPDLDGVFAASDPMAAGAMRAIRAAGRRIPDDIGIIGFDDQPTLAPAMNPPLTSVHQDPREQIRHMVRTLMALLAGEQVRPDTTVLPVTLEVRDSA
ncbi:LacI family transcriptional regulator [Actinophytocola xinjiangensis]|uniref:LacI family transcriptional regulator n=1 Tax=Actinophytocola xinjiangensis TaxID=485602 RepID=A0A7Z1AWT7_9PSEU|nr:LacI family DNA-binding transcriptional regulator [Actinophytocola xinjiangensis]OLF08316.1 LacI family transcriptional regulator [Actinophytocola xinjiangensis]